MPAFQELLFNLVYNIASRSLKISTKKKPFNTCRALYTKALKRLKRNINYKITKNLLETDKSCHGNSQKL